MQKHSVKELPEGYTKVLEIDEKNKKFALISTAVSLIISIIIAVILFFFLFMRKYSFLLT